MKENGFYAALCRTVFLVVSIVFLLLCASVSVWAQEVETQEENPASCRLLQNRNNDEAWILMQHEDSARFVFGIAKRARKYYLGLTTITQDVADFMSSPYGKPIVTNSSIQLLLKQSPAAIDIIAETFFLTEGEKYLLLESDVGEGIFFAGLKHAAIKIYSSYVEDQIITTDPKQLLDIKESKEELAG
jgi:hypothetical protein